MQAGPEPRPGEILMTSQTVFAVGEFQSPDIRRCQWSVWRENLQFGAQQLQHSTALWHAPLRLQAAARLGSAQYSSIKTGDERVLKAWSYAVQRDDYHVLRHVVGLLGLGQVADDLFNPDQTEPVTYML